MLLLLHIVEVTQQCKFGLSRSRIVVLEYVYWLRNSHPFLFAGLYFANFANLRVCPKNKKFLKKLEFSRNNIISA